MLSLRVLGERAPGVGGAWYKSWRIPEWLRCCVCWIMGLGRNGGGRASVGLLKEEDFWAGRRGGWGMCFWWAL